MKETSAKAKDKDLFILFISLTLSAQALTLCTMILSITFNGDTTDVSFLRNLQISFHITSTYAHIVATQWSQLLKQLSEFQHQE